MASCTKFPRYSGAFWRHHELAGDSHHQRHQQCADCARTRYRTIAPAKTISAKATIGWVGHGPGTGIVDPPIVVNDIANPATNQVFSFTGCSNIVGFGGAVNQIPAIFSSSTGFTTVDMDRLRDCVDVRPGTALKAAFDFCNMRITCSRRKRQLNCCAVTVG
jgi:hypothetical protein